MISTQTTNNRYSIGKYLRAQKKLRRADPTAKIIQPKKQLADYLHYLQQKGVVIKDLAVAQFKTKNGLPYYGLVATQLFKSNKIFIRVPVKCLLNTKVAFESDLRNFFLQNPRYFSKQFDSNWQDHILLGFLLYQFGKGQSSQWVHLIKNLPRQIDYVIFWDKKEIQLLEDPVLEKMIKKQLKKYHKQCQKFITIAKRYPQFFPPSILNQENIRWIHIHLVTRCFGKYFQYTTMVPFAQLLNHQCSDVYYTMYYNQQNPNNPHQQFYQEKLLTQQQIQQIDTSDGTYNSQEFEDDRQDFKFGWTNDSENLEPIVDSKIDQSLSKSVRDIENYLFNFINFGDNISIGYLLQTFQQLKKLKTIKGEFNQNIIRIELHRIQASNSIYLNLVKNYHNNTIKISAYSNTLQQKKNKPVKVYKSKSGNIQVHQNVKSDQEQSVQQQQQVEPYEDITQKQKYFPKKWEQQKFDQFLMLCSSKDQFQKNSQVFFCYGRLSNRMLLMRYGITLQHNKYNHIFIHVDPRDFILDFNKYQYFPRKMKQFKIPLIKKFKVKRTKFCVQLLTFLRGTYWKLHENVERIFYSKDLKIEFKIVRQFLQIMVKQLGKFSRSLQQNQKLSLSPSLNYHEYFSLIYIIQKQRILQQQIKLGKIVIQVLNRIQKKMTLQVAMLRIHDLQQSVDEMKRNRLMMKSYFDRFLINK